MRKGFTLLELLGIISLLGIIILVAVPSLIQSNKTAEINEKRDFNSIINSACISYIEVHSEEYNDLLTTNGTTKTIPASTLIKEGYLKATMKNPNSQEDNNTLEEESGNITATNTSGKITCTYNK